MTSIAALPDETLQQIFGLCWEDQPIAPPSRRSILYGVERILSHVCRRWRNVAIDTPQIWARIPVSWKKPSPRARVREPQIGRVETYLSRSRYAPLHIFWKHLDEHALNSGNNVTRRDNETFWEVVEKFGTHSLRWKTLHIETDNQVAAGSFLHIIYATSAPRLQAMTLDFWAMPGVQPSWHLYPAERPKNTLYPSLTRVELAGWDLRRVPGPFSRVTTLVVILTSLMSSESQELTRMLELLPSLETLIWKRPSGFALTLKEDTPMKTVTLPRLHTLVFLTLPLRYDATALVMCKAISAPNLTSLHLINHVEAEFAPLARYLISTPNAPPPFPNLQTLDLRPAHCEARGLTDHDSGGTSCKQWINSLLTITHLIIRSDILSPLLLHPDTKGAFPSLQTVTAFCNHGFSSDHQCKVIAFLRKFVAVRMELSTQPPVVATLINIDPSPRLQLYVFVPCSTAKANEEDMEWLMENATVRELDACPDELVGFDIIHYY